MFSGKYFAGDYCRITSYNVCYTKLLRDIAVERGLHHAVAGAEHLGDEHRQDPEQQPAERRLERFGHRQALELAAQAVEGLDVEASDQRADDGEQEVV